MDLEQSILAEHSKAQCMRITAYIGNDRERFARLMKLFLRGSSGQETPEIPKKMK